VPPDTLGRPAVTTTTRCSFALHLSLRLTIRVLPFFLTKQNAMLVRVVGAAAAGPAPAVMAVTAIIASRAARAPVRRRGNLIGFIVSTAPNGVGGRSWSHVGVVHASRADVRGNVYRQMKAIPAPPPQKRRFPRPPLLAVIAAVIAVAIAIVVVVLVLNGDDTKSTSSTSTRAEPVKADADALRKVAGAIGHPVYWAPGEAAATYEMTQTPDGRLYIRYLPDNVQIGDPRPNFLTIGTYPQKDAFASVQEGAKRAGAIKKALPGGGLSVAQADRPTSVFFAFPESTVLVEVYDPTAKRAETLVTSGAIRPIG
jgi:hypothetical protein